MALRCLLVPLALLTLACAPTDPTTLVIQSRTEQGLFQLARVVAVARVQALKEGGTSAYFTSDILPATMVTVHTEGKLRVARGMVLLTFVDREGRTQLVRATPEQPGTWTAAIRANRPQNQRNGFFLILKPLSGEPPEAVGVEVEVTYRPG